MGEKYKAELQEMIEQLGARNLRVYINPDGVHPQYYKHLEDTFKTSGVKFVTSREEANFVFEGHSEAASLPGRVVAYFSNEQLQFAGTL